MTEFDRNKIKLVAFDLDGTLTQHRSPLSDEHRAVLDQLSKKYKLLGPGGNDESVYLSDFGYITIDDYRDFPEKIKVLL